MFLLRLFKLRINLNEPSVIFFKNIGEIIPPSSHLILWSRFSGEVLLFHHQWLIDAAGSNDGGVSAAAHQEALLADLKLFVAFQYLKLYVSNYIGTAWLYLVEILP